MATTITYKGSDLTSFSNTSKTLRTAGKYLEGDITITAGIDVNNQNKTVIPSEVTQTVTADTGYSGLGTVTVNGITNTYVGSGVTRRDESDISQEYVSPEEVISIPQGYYVDDVSYVLPSGSFSVSSITVSASGQITAQANTSEEGYIKRGVGTANVHQLTTQLATTVIPSESTTTITGQKYMTGDITIAAITPTYVGSSVPAGEMLVSGPTVTATAGYYATALTETIDDAELNGNIVFSKQPVSIAVDNTGLVTATSELVRENMIINQAGGYIGYHTQEEYIISNGSTTYQLPVQAATTITPSSSTQTVTGQKYMTGNITIDPIPSQYIVPSGTLTITSVDTTTTFNATNYASVAVNLKDADVTAY